MGKLEKLSALVPMHEIEQGAQQQIYDILNLDFLIKMAIMPDVHQGYTMPIGGVALLDGVISSEFVGYDVGCGVSYYETDIKATDLSTKDREKIFKKIYESIPTGLGAGRSEPLEYPEFVSAHPKAKELSKFVNQKTVTQLGSLGAGNHMIEIGKNIAGNVTITIHSGSRNVGHQIATFYNNMFRNYDSSLPHGFVRIDSEMGQAYYHDMNFALQFALDNRKEMMRAIMEILGIGSINDKLRSMINENHNHAVVLDNNKVLHRKGATPADVGQLGVIPISMKDGVYVTKGLGNEEYLCSASHGAGRQMSRKKAKKTIDIGNFKKQMNGIVAKVNQSTLDEAPDAYKNADYVILSQDGIVVEIIDHSEPIINVKG